jgi:uncharacterized protein YidB (DUF937 family)
MDNKIINTKQFSDTDVQEVKRLNSQSGISYNEALSRLAKKYNEKR